MLAAWLALAVGLAWLFLDRQLDRAFIVYRYAANLAAGHGFGYNPGDGILINAASPPYVALLAGLSRLPVELPLLGSLVGAAAIVLGGAALYGMGFQEQDGLSAALAAGIYVALPGLWLLLGLETPLWMALCLAAVWMQVREHMLPAALLLALATLVRPESLILAAVLVIDLLISGRSLPLPAAGIYIGGIALGLLWGQSLAMGGPLPGLSPALVGMDDYSVPGGLIPLLSDLFALSWLWPGMLFVSGAGAILLREQRWALLLVSWAALQVAALGILRVNAGPWTYAPLYAALAALTGLGLAFFMQRLPPGWGALAAGLASALVVGTLSLTIYTFTLTPPDYEWGILTLPEVDTQAAEAGRWLAANTPPEAQVGITRLGALGYYAERPLIDYGGALDAELRAAQARGDGQWWIGARTPQVVVLSEEELHDLEGFDLTTDPWFTTTYEEAERIPASQADRPALLIFERTSDPRPLTETLVNYVTYPGGLTLNRIASDFSLAPLETGITGRVRLEWLLEEPIQRVHHVEMRIVGRDGTLLAQLGRPLDLSIWPRREFLTSYHSLQIASAANPGLYMVEVGVGPDPFNLEWRSIAEAKVPFPSSTFLGALSGASANFGEIRLEGYRLARTEAGLEVLLMWVAATRPPADYTVLVQVRDPAGAVAAELSTQPHGGAYPTSIWSSGEQVPDTYMIDDTSLPAGAYEVYVGLLAADGSRILTSDGLDMVLVGPVYISE